MNIEDILDKFEKATYVHHYSGDNVEIYVSPNYMYESEWCITYKDAVDVRMRTRSKVILVIENYTTFLLGNTEYQMYVKDMKVPWPPFSAKFKTALIVVKDKV